MAEIIRPPQFTGGGGPEDPMLGQRVERLEQKADRIEAILIRLEPRISEITSELRQITKEFGLVRTEIARVDGRLTGVEGRLGMLPTSWTLISFAIGSCLASAGLAFTIARLIKP
jgi:hypothetical protein